MKCSGNFEFKKRIHLNFITQNLRDLKEYCISKKKKLLKHCQKRRLYLNIFWLLRGGGPFFGWWVVVRGGGYNLVCGGWW